MPRGFVKKAARLDALKKILGEVNLKFSKESFPELAKALGKTDDTIASSDILSKLTDAGFSSQAKERKTILSQELSDLLSAAKGYNKDMDLAGMVHGMGRALDSGGGFDQFSQQAAGNAMGGAKNVIERRRLKRALTDALAASQVKQPSKSTLPLGLAVGVPAGVLGQRYYDKYKDTKQASDYSVGFVGKCRQLGYDHEMILKTAQDPNAVNVITNALTGSYGLSDIQDTLDVMGSRGSDYPKSLKDSRVLTTINDKGFSLKAENAKKIMELVSTIKGVLGLA